MKVMYRGVRLHEYQVEEILQSGMTYYWENPERCINDIFYAIGSHQLNKKLAKSGLFESVIREGSKKERLQLYGSNEKYIAESYARGTPELIHITLEYGGVKKETIRKYLDRIYGLPHLVTFNVVEDIHEGINTCLGNFIAPEFIVSVEPVDITKKDPIHERFQTI
jgi:hypothetical protein